MEKKSLIKTLKTTERANVVTSAAKNEGSTSRKLLAKKAAGVRFRRAKMVTGPGH